MKIAVALKIVPDDQDILVSAGGSLDFSKAKPIISIYDLNAIEAAVQSGAEVVAITVGSASIDDSKTKKSVLARGISELYMVADDALADADSYVTAAALANLLTKVGDVDAVFCGDGSADNYAQQVDVQLAAKLEWPVVSAAVKVEFSDGAATVDRVLEDVVETVEVTLPAVISVTPDIADPRIPGMKDILAAGKKPTNVSGAENAWDACIETIDVNAPEQTTRKLDVKEADDDSIAAFAAAIKAAM